MNFSRHRSWLPWLTLALLPLCVYSRVMYGGGFIWDDDNHITAQRIYHDPHALREIWLTIGATQQYYPLVFSSFLLERHLWGDSPHGYHVVNVALHTLSVLLLWRLLRRMGVEGAWLIAAIFAVHPVMVESVAWASERKNILSLFLSLLCAHAFLRSEMPELFARPRRGFYVLAFVFFVLAMFSKTVACTVPPAMLVIIWWRRGRITVRDCAAQIPFWIVGAGMGLLTAYVEREQIGAGGALFNFSPLDRVLIAGRALWFYAAKIIWPHPLIFSYPRWTIGARWQLLFPITIVLVIVSLWLLRRRIGRGPLAATLIFAGLLSPALGFVNVYPMRFSFVADHFQYFASIAMIALVVSLFLEMCRRMHAPLLVPIFAASVLMILAALTIIQQGMYHDVITLWSRTVQQNPRSLIANNDLGAALLSSGRNEEAAQCFRAAVAIDPEDRFAWLDLGTYFSRVNQHDKAIACYQRAIAVEPRHPDAHHMLGLEFQMRGQMVNAIFEFRRAVFFSPYDAVMWNDLGVAYTKVNQFDDARRAFEQSEKFGEYAPANYSLAILYARQGRTADVLRELQRALEIQPDYAPARKALERLTAP